MKKWIVFISSLALVAGFGIGSAFAAASGWTGSTATTQTVLIGANSANFKTVAANGTVVYTLAPGESLTANDTITITLTGGATFSTVTPTLKPGAGDLGAGGTTAAPPLSGGAAGSTTATWRVVSDVATGNSLTLNATTAIFDLTGVANMANVDIQITLTTSGGLTIGTASRSFSGDTATPPATNYLFTAGPASKVAVTAKSDTADVSSSTGAYTTISGQAAPGTAGTATVLDITNNSTGSTVPKSVGISSGKVLITLAGDFTGIKKIAGTGITGSDSTGTTDPTATGEFKINAAGTAAYAVVVGTGGTGLAANTTLSVAPQFTWDGTTAQKARTFTVAVDQLADGSTWNAYNAQAATALYTITRNGVSFTSDSIGALNTIKITDRSGNIQSGGGAILVSAYDKSGNAIPEAAGAAALSVSSFGTTTITGAELQAMFPSATPVLYEFAVETSSAVISNVKKTADGTNVTVYTNVGDGAL